MTSLTLETVDPTDEAALREWFTLRAAAQVHDVPDDVPPCWTDVRARLLVPVRGTAETVWLARSGGRTVGAAQIMLPTLDNPDNAMVDLLVAPEQRRRGFGRQLLEHLMDAGRTAGCKRLFVEAREPLDGGGPAPRFLTAMGGRKALADTRRRLRLDALDTAELARLRGEAERAAAGYTLEQWFGAPPEHRLDGMAGLVARMSTDVPLDDLHLAPEAWDAERLRGMEASRDARGLWRATTAAVAPDGALAGFSQVTGYATIGWFAHQSDTIVLGEHRGHRLGMLLKLANLDLVRERRPDVRVIDTYNADTNRHMIAINDALGCYPFDRLGEWEIDL
ncbi:GNAT family N-acetyltransferase [Pseudonocardia sp. TRM90224]|uniref:GNAT family N-acetyltransferase n=1 Tax=Pseudonocardia sp. TRM90224 TaxID=2812678 RepID=UPI001E5C42ED|nr:GNAT family N-acetyltransferase [Pseudonocardia sp. TRM90224]